MSCPQEGQVPIQMLCGGSNKILACLLVCSIDQLIYQVLQPIFLSIAHRLRIDLVACLKAGDSCYQSIKSNSLLRPPAHGHRGPSAGLFCGVLVRDGRARQRRADQLRCCQLLSRWTGGLPEGPGPLVNRECLYSPIHRPGLPTDHHPPPLANFYWSVDKEGRVKNLFFKFYGRQVCFGV